MLEFKNGGHVPSAFNCEDKIKILRNKAYSNECMEVIKLHLCIFISNLAIF